MNAREFLEQYFDFCDEVHELTQEENRLLRADQLLDEPFLTNQREVLQRLAFALDQLRAAEPPDPADRAAVRDLKERVQQKVLKILLLNRETEQLLLKNSVSRTIRPVQPAANPSKVRHAYAQHAA